MRGLLLRSGSVQSLKERKNGDVGRRQGAPGWIAVADVVKPTSAEAIREMKGWASGLDADRGQRADGPGSPVRWVLTRQAEVMPGDKAEG